jgi:hypothetical protein
MAAGSRLCRIAAIGLQLAAFLRQIGQTRLAATLERVYAFLSQVGQCDVPASLGTHRAAMQAAISGDLDDLGAALELARIAVEATGETF